MHLHLKLSLHAQKMVIQYILAHCVEMKVKRMRYLQRDIATNQL